MIQSNFLKIIFSWIFILPSFPSLRHWVQTYFLIYYFCLIFLLKFPNLSTTVFKGLEILLYDSFLLKWKLSQNLHFMGVSLWPSS